MEVGEYARTKDGNFGIIENVDENYIDLKINDKIGISVLEEDIFIHNEDLFYVLLPGDYINGIEGGRIKAKVSDNIGNYFLVGHNGMFFPNEIKSVITAEQYKKLKELKQQERELRQKEKQIKQEKAELKQKAKDFEEKSTYIL